MAALLGKSARWVQEEMDAEELEGWSAYLGTVFAPQVQDDLRAGWLVHVIRCMMAPKGVTPKFRDSVPPVGRMMAEFFKPDTVAETPSGKLALYAEIDRKRLEMKDRERRWKNGELMVDGLYINEKAAPPGGAEA